MDFYPGIVIDSHSSRVMAETDEEPLVEMIGIEKRFGRVNALAGVDLDLERNEIHGLLGDNGSGKSTLVKTLVGVHAPDAGEIFIRGERARIRSPTDAREHGIATVYQDLALVGELTVAANIFLGRNPTRRVGYLFDVIDWKTMNERARQILEERLNIELDPTQRVEFLSGGERQAIAIARALITEPDIVIMDEPTSALSADSVSRVHELIRTLKREGLTVLIISHNIDEVFSLTDRLTVLDNGNLVGTVRTADVTNDQVLRMIIEGKMPEEAVEGASAASS